MSVQRQSIAEKQNNESDPAPPQDPTVVTVDIEDEEKLAELLKTAKPGERIDRRKSRTRESGRVDLTPDISTEHLDSLERERQREQLARITPSTSEPPGTTAFREAQEARRQAGQLEATLAEQSVIAAQNISDAQSQIDMLEDNPGGYTIDGEPVTRSVIAGLKKNLADYKQGYIDYVKDVSEATTGQREYANATMRAIGEWSNKVVSRGKDVKRQEQIFNSTLQANIGFGSFGETEPRLDDALRTGSRKILEETKAIPKGTVTNIAGIPVDAVSLGYIQSVVTGALERTTTPITSLIPGKQPFEASPVETSVTFKDIKALTPDIDKTNLFALRTVQMGTEFLAILGTSFGLGKVTGVAAGASGTIISKIPKVGSFVSAGSSKILALTKAYPKITAAVLSIPIIGQEISLTSMRIQAGKDRTELVTGVVFDLTKVFGFGAGFSSGLRAERSLEAELKRTLYGGTTFQEAQLIPPEVTSGKESFPSFKGQKIKPSEKGFKEFSERFTPDELRIGKGNVSAFSATTSKFGKGFTVKEGLSARGEQGMFFAPAVSKNFLRLTQAEAIKPGIPNIFGTPNIIYGEFPDVVATGFSKTSPSLFQILESGRGTGKLFMPSEQLAEAQAILSPGTLMSKINKGNFFLRTKEGLIQINRFLPSITKTLPSIVGKPIPFSSLTSTPLSSKSIPLFPFLRIGSSKTVGKTFTGFDTSKLTSNIKAFNSIISSSNFSSTGKVSSILKKSSRSFDPSSLLSAPSFLSTPSKPSDPSKPSKPSDPSKPSKPSDPSQPSYPSFPSRPSSPSYTPSPTYYPRQPTSSVLSYNPTRRRKKKTESDTPKEKKAKRKIAETRKDPLGALTINVIGFNPLKGRKKQ